MAEPRRDRNGKRILRVSPSLLPKGKSLWHDPFREQRFPSNGFVVSEKSRRCGSFVGERSPGSGLFVAPRTSQSPPVESCTRGLKLATCRTSVDWVAPNASRRRVILRCIDLDAGTIAGFAVCSRPQWFSILNISCSLCVTSTRIPTTHHIILAGSNGSEHSPDRDKVSLSRQERTNVSRNPGASWRLGFCRPRHCGRN